MPEFPQILLSRELDPMPPLGIAGLVDHEHTPRMRPQIGVRLPLLQPPAVERLRTPGRILQEVVQRLPIRSGHDGPQFDQRRVVLARQEQADEILAQRRALLYSREEVLKRGTTLVNRLRGRCRRLALGGHGRCSLSTRLAKSGTPLLKLLPATGSTIHA
jgi:hypothetical protein